MSATRSTTTEQAEAVAMMLAQIASVRPDLKSYIESLSQDEIISILRVIAHHQHDKDIEFTISVMKTAPISYLVMVLCFQLTQFNDHTDRELINRCKAILESLKKDPIDLFKAISILDDDDDKSDFMTDDDYIVKVDDKTAHLSRADDLGIQLLYYNICPEDNVVINDIDEERKQHSIITVIEKKIKFKHVLKAIQKYIDGHLFNNTNEISVLGEVAKKFNLNFRIHVYNSEKQCEELLRPDNNGWLIKLKPNQTKFEIGKVDKHFFNYEYLSIPREYLNNVNKIYTYISLIGRCKRSDDYETCEPCCSNLELITALKKFKIVVYDKSIGKLVYKNSKISDNTGLNENTMNLILQTLHLNPDLMKYARKNEYKMIGSINK